VNEVKTSIQIEVRSTEIDGMEHVNNAKYLEYMEWSRGDWYHQVGLSSAVFTGMGVGTVIANVDIHYRKEAKLGQKLTISTEPVRKGRTSFVLKHEIHNEQEELIAEADVVSVIIDLTTRRPVLLPEALARQFRGGGA
jgi:thioesterase III